MKYFTKASPIVRELVIADFKVRYQGSALGYLWSLARPLFMFAILYVIFNNFLKIGSSIPNYPIYLLLGILLWGFFSEVTSNGTTAVVNSADLIKKVRIPRYLTVVSVFISALINFSINLVVFFVFVMLSNVDVSIDWLLLIPLIIELSLLSIALILILAPLYVKYRDIKFIWELVLQAGFYITPILYPLSLIPEAYQKLMLLSPLAQIIQDARYLVVSQETMISWGSSSLVFQLIPLLIILVLLSIGIPYFRSQSRYFAENI